MYHDYQYMVDFTLPTTLSEDFLQLIPQQRAKANQLFNEGKLLNYALSLDNHKMWAVFSASSELEVNEMLDAMPLTRFMEFQISILTFFNTVNVETAVFSVN